MPKPNLSSHYLAGPIVAMAVGMLVLLILPLQAGASLVVDRHIEYATGIDPTKSALLPGQTSSGANIINSLGGITGIYIDILGFPAGGGIGSGDLGFRVGNSTDISSWTPLGIAPAVSTTSGAGNGGSDRVYLSWPSASVENTWLEITLAASASTGLGSPDVFYYGHMAGDTNGDGAVTPADALLIINELNDPANLPAVVGAENPFDVNRDGRITATDLLLVQNILRDGAPEPLVTLSPPVPQPVPLPAAAWLFATALTGLFAVNRRRQSIARGHLAIDA